jgi:hypothetical protein
MANFDINSWQQITISGSERQSLDGSVLYTEGQGSVFFQDTNVTRPEQQWQIYPFNSSYVLRTQGSGPEGYMNVAAGVQDSSSTLGATVPDMRNSSLSGPSMFWQITPWGDGTFFFTNSANGSAWHLTLLPPVPNSLMAMTSNITAPQSGQRFTFKKLGAINDERYSSVIVCEFVWMSV